MILAGALVFAFLELVLLVLALAAPAFEAPLFEAVAFDALAFEPLAFEAVFLVEVILARLAIEDLHVAAPQESTGERGWIGPAGAVGSQPRVDGIDAVTRLRPKLDPGRQ
jgi:hypothetical protein